MASNVVHNLSVPTLLETDVAVFQVLEKTGKINLLFFNNGEKIAQAGQGGMKAGSEIQLKFWESDDRSTWTSLMAAGPAISVTATNATNLFTAGAAHGLTNGDTVNLGAAGDDVPAGTAIDTDYFVINATATTFQISATKGGAAVTFSDDGTTVTANLTGAFLKVSEGATEDASILTNKKYLKITGKGTTGPGYVRCDIQHRGDPYFGQVDIDLIAKSGYGKDGDTPSTTNGVAVFGGDPWPE